jgi:hypothetical protein
MRRPVGWDAGREPAPFATCPRTGEWALSPNAGGSAAATSPGLNADTMRAVTRAAGAWRTNCETDTIPPALAARRLVLADDGAQTTRSRYGWLCAKSTGAPSKGRPYPLECMAVRHEATLTCKQFSMRVTYDPESDVA